jgi:hypothetical protein
VTIRPGTGALIEFLDSLSKIDPVAMGRLVGFRVPCSDAFRIHPTVQVGVAVEASAEFGGLRPDASVVGLLGILNGFAGVYETGRFAGWGPVAAIVEDDGSVSGFKATAPLDGSC